MSAWFRAHRHLYPANWDEIAAGVKAAAGHRCAACESPGDGRNSLGVHHVNMTPGDCQPSNLVALCWSCHTAAHRLRPRPVTRDETIARLRRRHELEIGQLCLALRIQP
jgi:predicted HNH restriction endonuclease